MCDSFLWGGYHLSDFDLYNSYSIEDLVKAHRIDREKFDRHMLEENAFLSEKCAKFNYMFPKIVNFYLLDVYVRYGIVEETALELVSKITGIAKEKLKGAKDLNLSLDDLEKCINAKPYIDNLSYDFDTSTIYIDMQNLLNLSNFNNSNIPNKISIVNDALEYFLKTKFRVEPTLSVYANNRNVKELVELMNAYCVDNKDIWNIVHYLLYIIGEIREPAFIICSVDNEKFKDNPYIDMNKNEITIYQNTSPSEVFKIIYDRLFNIDYLDKGRVLKKT